MAKRPMPVPRNLGGAPGPRISDRKAEKGGLNPLGVLAVALFVLLLACSCIAGLASTRGDGAHQSDLPVIGATSNYMCYGPTDAIAPSVFAGQRGGVCNSSYYKGPQIEPGTSAIRGLPMVGRLEEGRSRLRRWRPGAEVAVHVERMGSRRVV